MKHLLLPFLLFSLPISVHAATFQMGETVEVRAEDHTYALGRLVQLSTPAQGDLFLLGETIEVMAGAKGDVMAAGKSVIVNGSIVESLHAVGRTVLLNEAVGEDVLLVGQEVVTVPNVRIEGTTFLMGQKITAAGRFEKDAKLFGESVTLAGVFHGNVDVHAGDLTISESALIKGNLHLSIPEGRVVRIPEGVVQGKVEKNLLMPHRSERRSFLGRMNVLSLISTLLLGSALIACAPSFGRRFGSDVRKKYWKIFGVGLLMLLLPPIIALFLFFPIITFPIGLILLLVWGGTLFFGKILAGLLLAQLLFPFTREISVQRMIIIFALMTLFLFFLKFLPLFGHLLVLTTFLLSLGALVFYKWSTLKILRKAGMV